MARRARPAEDNALTDLSDARAFCQVVDLGSVTKAAAAVGEGKGSISKRLARLERAIGVTLLARGGRVMRPTDEGILFRQRLGAALGLLDQATQELRGAHAAPRGRLRLTAPQDIATALLGPLIAEFATLYPAISVDTVVTERLLDFEKDQLDVALRASLSLPDSSLVARKLLNLYIGLFAAPQYLKKQRAPRRLDELSQHRLLTCFGSSKGLQVRFEHRERKTARTLTVVPQLWSNDASLVRELALSGAGIALLPCLSVREEVARGRLTPVLGDFQVMGPAGLYLVHAPARFLSPKVKAFRDFLLERLATAAV